MKPKTIRWCWGSGMLLLCGACRPNVAASTASGGSGDGGTSSAPQGTTTGGMGSDTNSESSESGGTGETGEEPQPPAVVRAVYESPQGIEFRDVVAGVIGEPQVLIPGDWSMDPITGDELVGNRLLDFEISNWREPDTERWTVQCPTKNTCNLFKAEDAWRIKEFDFASGTHALYEFQLGSDGPTPPTVIYPLGQGETWGGSGPYSVVKEFDETGAGRFARLLYEPDAEPETFFLFEDEASIGIRSIGDHDPPLHVVYGTETTPGGWNPEMWLVDVASERPSPQRLPLLPGAVGHAGSIVAVHPGGDGLVVTQGNDEGEGDLVWIPLEGSKVGAPVRISTGAAQGLVRPPGGGGSPVFDTEGRWLAYVVWPDGGLPQGFVVSWPDGEPVAVSEESRGMFFAPDGSHVYFHSGPAGDRQLSRVALTDGVVGVEQTLSDSFASGPTAKISSDGSTLGMDSEYGDKVWLLDLTTTPPVAQRADGCEGWEVSFGLSADGSVLVCSSEAEYSTDREYVLLAVESGQTVPIDARHGAALLSP